MDIVYIYALCEPGTDEVRYVGLTAKTPLSRLKQHMTGSLGLNTPAAEWFKSLRAQKKLPDILILDEVENQREAEERERYWIDRYLKEGAKLTNDRYNTPWLNVVIKKRAKE